ncbi:chloramphenicol acetyltransferase [Vibrio variabilis]|uniref:Chloramphenicol acetyltransferase n=1 Tax=Vibrio variabilis TaxID=990271 RepID=A0ABQ0J762_9VIBR|nr:chloramphenicol acetyltransferase [Vibrio variabilis]
MSQPLSPKLSAAPSVTPCSRLHRTELGRWTEIAERCVLNNVTVGDYSYIQNDSNLMFTTVGKFTSIAAAVRINQATTMWRPTLHHFTYRPGNMD